MKKNLLCSLITFLLFMQCSLLIAAEQANDDPGKLSIEKIIEDCEKQYNENKYPDADERNRLIDQCIEDNSAEAPDQPAAAE